VAPNVGLRGITWTLENGYRFTAAATTTFLGLYDSTNDTVQHTMHLLNVGSYGSRIISISGESTNATWTTAGVDIKAVNTAGTTTLSVRQGAVSVDNASLSVDYGLNVGTATGATTGQVKASAGLSATTGTFSGDVSANDAAFSGGLNVGSATGAAAGAIKASAGISGTTGTFSSTVSGTSGTFTTGLNVGIATGAGAGQIKAANVVLSAYLIVGTEATFSGPIFANDYLSCSGHMVVDGDMVVDGQLESSFSNTWINTSLTFNTSWSNFAADETTWSFARYKRVGDFVFLRGMIKRASGTGLSLSPFTLPANFRPAKRLICAVMALRNGQTDESIRADVLATGVVQFSNIGTTSAYDYISLNGIVFSVV
jgi:hypothetical protein